MIISIFKSIGRGVKATAIWVSNIFIALFGRDASEQFARSALAILKSDFGKIVLTVVTTLATTNLTNEQRRAEAFTHIKTAALAAGIDAKDSIVNLLIELAVSTIKQNFGEASQ